MVVPNLQRIWLLSNNRFGEAAIWFVVTVKVRVGCSKQVANHCHLPTFFCHAMRQKKRFFLRFPLSKFETVNIKEKTIEFYAI